jgi:positive regulator of sigma E activity
MVLGFGLLVRAEVRRLRRADEYQRTQQLESLALAYVVVVVLLFGAGLLDSLGVGDARVSLQVSFIGGVLAWSLARMVSERRV